MLTIDLRSTVDCVIGLHYQFLARVLQGVGLTLERQGGTKGVTDAFDPSISSVRCASHRQLERSLNEMNVPIADR